MIKKLAFKVLIYSIPIILDVQSTPLQFTHFMTAVQTFMPDRIIFEQFRERLIQSLQKNRSIDLGSLQALLDFYGIKQQAASRNGAIELILKAYHSKSKLLQGQDSTTNILQINQELPLAASQIRKFDFRIMNEAAGLTFLARAPRGPENYALSYQGKYLSMGLDLHPVTAVMAPYERIMDFEARRDMMRFCIENDPTMRFEYHLQRSVCIELIKRMLDFSENYDALAAQLSINNLILPDIYDEGAILCDWVKPGIQNVLFKDGNFIAVDTQQKLGKLLEIVHPFLNEALHANEYMKLLQEFKHKGVPTADILLKRVLGTSGWWDSIKNTVSEALTPFPQMIDEEIRQSRMLQNCTKIASLCKQEKFDEARKIVASLQVYSGPESVFQINEAHYLSKIVENEYSTVFNSYGIRYTDTIDPYYPVFKHILDACPYAQKHELQKAIQETIKERSAQLDTLLSRATTVQKESSFIKAVGYKILDAQNTNEVVDVLSNFAKDHSDETVRNAYSVFVSNGFPSFLSVNECAKNFYMPASIETLANQDIRKWYGYCAAFKIENDSQKELIQRSLEHLSLACKEYLYKDDHLYMAQRFYADAASVSGQKLFLKMPNLARYDVASITGQLQREVLRKSCKELASAPDEKEICKIIKKANQVVNKIQSGKLKAVQDLEKAWNIQAECAVLSGTSEIYPENKLEVVEEEFTPPYGCGTSFLDEFQRAFFDFNHEVFDWEEPYGGACFPGSERAKNLFDPESQEIEEEIDVDAIPQCNAGQQTLPSFGDSEEEAEEEEKKEDDKNSEEARKNEIEIIENIIRDALEGKSITEEQAANLEKFRIQLIQLLREYGEGAFSEAIEAYNLNYYKLLKKETMTALNELVDSIKKINNYAEYVSFKHDVASNGKITTASIQEAIAGIACIKQEILGELIRAKNKEEDFEELTTGKLWDVKTARSFSLEGLKIFKPDSFCDALSKAYESNQDENLIVQITNLSDSDLQKLYDVMFKRFSIDEIKRTIVVDANNSERSKKTDDLIRMWEGKNVSNN